jgi:hypothetical protein
MDSLNSKPKLVFFQFKYDANLPEFLLIHKQEHVKCLSEFFEVTAIDEDCDYQEICDRYQPDLTLFETGLQLLTCRKPNISNIRACPEIPRLALHNSDAWCETRAGILSDMEHWGIEASFSIAATAPEHTPSIADHLFIWPNSIDPEVYRDYGESKNIPVLFTGSTDPQYPWRHKIYKLISEVYPSLFCPHRGYHARAAAGQVIFGERYARMINASWCVPACGTVAKEAVRKHFEIPACRSCLVTEKSQALEAAGFVDMENCVFCDENDVLDKLVHLFRNPDDMNRIINAGYELVQSRHTFKQRDQIRQWFLLNKDLQGNQRIVQDNPFGGLRLVEESSGIRNTYVICDGLHLQLLHQGDENLWAGRYAEAEKLYLRCSNYMRRLPEAKFRLALCKLYSGNGQAALDLILGLIQYILVNYKAKDPDPVEWAYYIVTLLCLGNLDAARKRASEFPALRHPELDRVRWLILALGGEESSTSPSGDLNGSYRRSIHQMPKRSFPEWSEQIRMMLEACGQDNLVEQLQAAVSASEQPNQQDRVPAEDSRGKLGKREGDVRRSLINSGFLFRPVVSWPIFFGWRRILERVRVRGTDLLFKKLHDLEAKFGCFLPYPLSKMRNDEFFTLLENVSREEEIKTVLVIGAAKGEGTTEALLTGIQANRTKAVAFCLNGLGPRLAGREKTGRNDRVGKWYRASASSPEGGVEELAKSIRSIKELNRIDSFDAVLIDGSEVQDQKSMDPTLVEELDRARFVLLDDINKWYNYQIHERLLQDANFELVACNPGWRNGYAFFKRGCQDELDGNEVCHEGTYVTADCPA